MKPVSTAVAFVVATLGIALFSVMDAVMKGLVLAIGAYATLFWRSLVSLGLSSALYLPQRQGWPSRKTLRIHIGRGALTTVMGVLFFWGLGRVPLAQAIALAFIAPLISLYLAAVLLHEKVGGKTVGASVVAFGGVLLIFLGQARADLGREALIGSFAILCSALCYALNIILMRRQSLAAGPVEIGFFQNMTVAVLMLAALPLLGTELPSLATWPWIVGAALLSTGSLMILSWAYAHAEASYLAATEYTSFLWAALLGWIFFSEEVSLYTLAGAALIVAGCIFAARRPEEANPHLEAAA
ncbi:MAG TPA: DMT family transporter [Allosphingosinicella sp.]|uniref:DMT family transporter n=1 Tax=Allosphingosinicella sp. TaxID=2823234 RepID=UPI002ED9EAF4